MIHRGIAEPGPLQNDGSVEIHPRAPLIASMR